MTTESIPTNALSLSAKDAAKGWAMYTPPSVSASKTLIIIGEAPGADEEASGIPFVGSAGRQLSSAFEQSGLDRRQWHILNTFLKRPPNNDLALVDKSTGDTSQAWTLNKTEFKREYGYVPLTTPLKKRYLRPEHQWQIAELQERLRALKPDLILAMGATALWALSGQDAITQFRGTFFTSPYGRAIATLHPASVLYQYSNLPFLWADLVKVRLFLEDALPAPLRRRLYFNPTLAEIECVYKMFLSRPRERVGVDIETCPSIDQITTVGYSFPDLGICIPFWDRHEPDPAKQNYWRTVQEERVAWRWAKRFAELPNPKVLQNGMYDSQYLLDAPVEIRMKNWQDDTALIQHSYQPELKKDLGTLSSLYLNEPSWKQMRQTAKDAKADE
jgi:DNA polymerase